MKTEKCPVWSKAESNYGLFPLLCVLTILVLAAAAALVAYKLRPDASAKTTPLPN